MVGNRLIVVVFNVYLFLRERERDRDSVSSGGAEREGDTESKAGSRLQAVSTEIGRASCRERVYVLV